MVNGSTVNRRFTEWPKFRKVNLEVSNKSFLKIWKDAWYLNRYIGLNKSGFHCLFYLICYQVVIVQVIITLLSMKIIILLILCLNSFLLFINLFRYL